MDGGLSAGIPRERSFKMAHINDIYKRKEVLAFMAVTSSSNSGGTEVTTTTNFRMRKFTSLSQSKNPQEYARQYVDEDFQRADVVGYSPQIAYAFDYHYLNPVHTVIRTITDGELTGDDAVVEIIWVDTVSGEAYKRSYSVIPDTEGDNLNAYTYSGNFKARGESSKGTAATSDDWATCTFTEDT